MTAEVVPVIRRRRNNVSDLEAVLETKRLMNGKPVIVVLQLSDPTVVAAGEPYASRS